MKLSVISVADSVRILDQDEPGVGVNCNGGLGK